MAMGYTDRTNDFSQLVNQATDRARQDTALAEEARARANAAMWQVPGQAMQGAVQGYMQGAQFNQQKQANQQLAQQRQQQMALTGIQTQAAQDQLHQEQARHAAIGQVPGLQEQAWQAEARAPLTEEEHYQQDYKLRQQANQIAMQNAGLNAQQVKFNLAQGQKQARIQEGSATAAGMLREAQNRRDQYNQMQASGESPFVLASTAPSMPTNQDLLQQLQAKGYSPDEVYQIAGNVLPAGGASLLTQQAITDQTTGFSPISEKAGKYAQAIQAFENAKDIYSREGGEVFGTKAADDAVEKVAQALDMADKPQMAAQLRKGVFSRYAGLATGEKSANMNALLKDYSEKLKQEAQGEIVSSINSLPINVRAQPHVQEIKQKWESGNLPMMKPAWRLNNQPQQQVPVMTGKSGAANIQMHPQANNIFNKY